MRLLPIVLAIVVGLASAARAQERPAPKALGLIDHARSHFEANCLPCHRATKPYPFPRPNVWAPGFGDSELSDGLGARRLRLPGPGLTADECRAVREWLAGRTV
jgi:hypothetical protein